MNKIRLILIVHNVRSAYNVGSILRSADGFGVDSVYFTGFTPYPLSTSDPRLPHIADKVDRRIKKTALGAEKHVKWAHEDDVFKLVNRLKNKQYEVAALEQASKSISLPDYIAPGSLALILGNEIDGIEPELLELCDSVLEIPMQGTKESFNVAAAAAIAIYRFRCH